MRWIVGGLVVMFGPVLFMAFLVGLFVQPWAPWWFGQQAQPLGVVPIDGVLPVDPDTMAPITGMVSDAQRYQLARMAGWSAQDAVLATAISIAEDGSGNPAALSPPNRDGSRDLGLWQINSGWWALFGGQHALVDPWNNARAAFYIYGRQGWCAWSVYLASCGPGHTGTFSAFLQRAQAAALVQPPTNQT